jgi:hypothetical protein
MGEKAGRKTSKREAPQDDDGHGPQTSFSVGEQTTADSTPGGGGDLGVGRQTTLIRVVRVGRLLGLRGRTPQGGRREVWRRRPVQMQGRGKSAAGCSRCSVGAERAKE